MQVISFKLVSKSRLLSIDFTWGRCWLICGCWCWCRCRMVFNGQKNYDAQKFTLCVIFFARNIIYFFYCIYHGIALPVYHNGIRQLARDVRHQRSQQQELPNQLRTISTKYTLYTLHLCKSMKLNVFFFFQIKKNHFHSFILNVDFRYSSMCFFSLFLLIE